MVDAPTLPAPLSDETRKLRKALLVTTAILAAIAYGGIRISKIGQLGLEMTLAQHTTLVLALGAVESYLLLLFYFGQAAEKEAWLAEFQKYERRLESHALELMKSLSIINNMNVLLDGALAAGPKIDAIQPYLPPKLAEQLRTAVNTLRNELLITLWKAIGKPGLAVPTEGDPARPKLFDHLDIVAALGKLSIGPRPEVKGLQRPHKEHDAVMRLTSQAFEAVENSLNRLKVRTIIECDVPFAIAMLVFATVPFARLFE